ncbi:hypothetical protein [Oceanicaulis sp.]|uniref:hypothetical protein n=1 Tax=Oceanicaulis sp. TaxID=1924941 RepID=UPI003F72F4CC
MNKLSVAAIASSALLGLSTLATGSAMADDSIRCQEQAEETCAMFVPRGTAQWAGCVENLFALCMGQLPDAGFDGAKGLRKSCDLS